jgi:hypothetical protein
VKAVWWWCEWKDRMDERERMDDFVKKKKGKRRGCKTSWYLKEKFFNLIKFIDHSFYYNKETNIFFVMK